MSEWDDASFLTGKIVNNYITHFKVTVNSFERLPLLVRVISVEFQMLNILICGCLTR